MKRRNLKYCILIYIRQDATLHSLFYPETALRVSGGTTTCHRERRQLYLQRLVFVTALLLSAAFVEDFPSSGAQTTVSTASGICYVATDICRFRRRFPIIRSVNNCIYSIWYLLRRYWYLLSWKSSNSSTIAAGSSNDVTNTRYCRYGNRNI